MGMTPTVCHMTQAVQHADASKLLLVLDRGCGVLQHVQRSGHFMLYDSGCAASSAAGQRLRCQLGSMPAIPNNYQLLQQR